MMIHASDVIVIAMAESSSMSNSESLVAFIHGGTLCYIPCHLIGACLGDEASQGLLYMLYQFVILSPHSMALAKTAWSV